MRPEEIEQQSFEIIRTGLRAVELASGTEDIVVRVIHATADFDFAKNMRFSEGAVEAGRAALADGCPIVTDTAMAMAGINKKALARLGSAAYCCIADEDVASMSVWMGCTRSRVAVDKAAGLWPQGIYVVGNAPTALIRICELVAEGKLQPALVIGVPVGFVQVEQSKEALMCCNVPWITACGQKGGSTVAAAICNALMYGIPEGQKAAEKPL